MSNDPDSVYQIAPLLIKIHHFLNTRLSFVDVAEELKGVRNHQKDNGVLYLKGLQELDHTLGELEKSMKEEIHRFESEGEFNNHLLSEKLDDMKRFIAKIGGK